MKIFNNILVFLICTFILLPVFSFGQKTGEQVFKGTCFACHTIGKGKLIGPDLINVQNERPEAWLIKFIRSSQSVINSGDKYADSLFQAYNKVIMPDQLDLTDEDIRNVISYIKEQSAKMSYDEDDVTTAETEEEEEDLVGDAERGKALFVGNIRFANDGPTCNSCHNVSMEGLLSGGGLAKDLTQVYSRLGAQGTKAVISGLPYPQMKQSYESHPVDNQEIEDIVAFLKEADDHASVVSTAGVKTTMLFGGIGGALFLIGLFSIFWIKRKNRPVNYSIFDRQIKSS